MNKTLDISWNEGATLNYLHDITRTFRAIQGCWPEQILITKYQQDHIFSSYNDDADKTPWLTYNGIPLKVMEEPTDARRLDVS